MVPEHSHVRIAIGHLDREIHVQYIWQLESLLWVALLPCAKEAITLDVLREVIAKDGTCELNPEGFEVAFVGAFQIQ
jgi:hypothetical protein